MLMEAHARRTVVVTLTMDEQDLHLLSMMSLVHVSDETLAMHGVSRADLAEWHDHIARVCEMAGNE